MADQLNLWTDAAEPWFRLDATGPTSGRKLRGYQLFLALFPDEGDAARIAQAITTVRSLHGLVGAPLLPDRLHISLHGIGPARDAIPRAEVEAVITAANRVVCPPLPIVFDHVQSFSGSNAFVLRCDPGSDAAVEGLRQRLALELKRLRLRHTASATPHMTMLYDPRIVAEQPIEPIRWTATRFALILSHQGVTHYQWIRQWNLETRP